MKKVPVAKRSAASRKAWRTRKKMMEARIVVEQDLKDPNRINVLFAPELATMAADFVKQMTDPKRKYRHALPCPNFGDKR